MELTLWFRVLGISCEAFYYMLTRLSMPLENLDISDLHEIASENLTRLSQDGDIILAILFQHASDIKDLVFLLVIPVHEVPSLSPTSSAPK
jgi:hypothetical protein